MKNVCMSVCLIFCMIGFADVSARNQYKEYQLQPGKVYEIKCKKDTGATTVVFPSAISRVAAFNVSTDAAKDFMLRMQPGGSVFDLVCLNAGKEATINIMYNQQLYILHLSHDKDSAYAVVKFGRPSSRMLGHVNRQVRVSGNRLLSMIDLAKSYPVIAQHNPELLADAARKVCDTVFVFDDFKLILQEVIRFDREDTLVFKVKLLNDKDYDIPYDPYTFTAQAGGMLYPASAVSSSGIMRAKTASYVFFTITGSSTAGRNNLSPDNPFVVSVTTKKMVDDLYRTRRIAVSSDERLGVAHHAVNERAGQ